MMWCYTLQNVQDDESRDLVDEGIAATYSYKSDAAAMIWARYRYAVLNTTDLDRWVQRFKDRVTQLDRRYSLIFSAYSAMQTAGDLTDIDSIDTETENHTNNGTANRTTTDSDSSTVDTTQTGETLPATSGSSASSWLDQRNISNSTGSQTRNGTDNTTTTDTGEITRTHNYHNGMIPAELLDKLRNNLFDPYYEYAGEFRDLFIQMYDNEACGCYR